MGFGAGLAIGTSLLGGIVSGLGEQKKEQKKKREKDRLKEQARALEKEVAPLGAALDFAFAPGGSLQQVLEAQGLTQAQIAGMNEEDQNRALAALQGGTRAGVLNRRIGAFPQLYGQALTGAPVAALGRRTGLDLTRRGFALDRQQFPQFRNELIGFGEGIRQFGQAFTEAEEVER